MLQRAGRRQHKGRQLTSTVGEKPGDEHEHDSGDNDEASEGVADDDLDGEAVVAGDLVGGAGVGGPSLLHLGRVVGVTARARSLWHTKTGPL